MSVKLWHDDVRLPPDGWVWARTNAQAQVILLALKVEEISLDHDLGLESLDPESESEPEVMAFAGRSQDGTGLDLVHWMIRKGLVPRKVTIHSWNPEGAANMAAALNRHGYDCYISPFKA